MLTLHFGGYSYLSLKFLADSIDPPCTKFQVPLDKKKCYRCIMKPACRDMSKFISLCSKITSELPNTGTRLTKIPIDD